MVKFPIYSKGEGKEMQKSIRLTLIIVFSLFFCIVQFNAEDKKDVSFYLKKAQEYNQKGNNKDALVCYSRALSGKPSKKQQRLIWFNLGTIYEEEKEYEKAIIVYKKLLSLGTGKWEGHFNLGRVYQTVELDDLAISSYEKVIKIKPEIFQVWFNLGKIYQKKKFYVRALECYKKAQSINESNVEICMELVNIYEKLGRFDIAISYLQNILTLYPREEYFSRLGLLYFSRNMIDEAINIFQKVLNKNPQNLEAHLHLGYIYFKKDFIENSVNEFTTVINLDSNNALAYFLRGLVYYKEGKDDLSKQDCLIAASLAKGKMLKVYARKILDKLNQ